MHAQWSDDFHHAVHVALTGETSGYYADFAHLDALAKVITSGFFHDGTWSSFRGRPHGRPIDTTTMPAWRLVVADQTHDQAGTVPRRPPQRHARCRPAAIAAVLLLAGPFTPMLFMGEEWGATTPWQFFTAHPEPELGRATAEGRIGEFTRRPDGILLTVCPTRRTRRRSCAPSWTGASRPAATTPGCWRRTVTSSVCAVVCRRSPIRTWKARCEYDEAAGWFLVDRGGVTVAVNFGAAPVDVAVTGEVLLATDEAVTAGDTGLTLPGTARRSFRRCGR